LNRGKDSKRLILTEKFFINRVLTALILGNLLPDICNHILNCQKAIKISKYREGGEEVNIAIFAEML